jgi:hypothetical protein
MANILNALYNKHHRTLTIECTEVGKEGVQAWKYIYITWCVFIVAKFRCTLFVHKVQGLFNILAYVNVGQV